MQSFARRACDRPLSAISYTLSDRCEPVSRPMVVRRDSQRSAAPLSSTIHSLRLRYSDWLVQNAQSRSDLRRVVSILAQRVRGEQNLSREQLKQHTAKTEHIRSHQLLQVQRRRVQFFGSQITRLQNAFISARKALRGEAIILHQILARLLEFYVPILLHRPPIEMCPCSFRIS